MAEEPENMHLVGMTSLLMASKLLSKKPFNMKLCLSVLQQESYFKAKDILRVESRIVQTTGWNLSPVTVINFLDLYLGMIKIRMPREVS